jgi:hypothetical protein
MSPIPVPALSSKSSSGCDCCLSSSYGLSAPSVIEFAVDALLAADIFLFSESPVIKLLAASPNTAVLL